MIDVFQTPPRLRLDVQVIFVALMTSRRENWHSRNLWDMWKCCVRYILEKAGASEFEHGDSRTVVEVL